MSESGSSRPSSRTPQYCRQRRKGKPDIGFCRIDGRKISLGRYGTPESLSRYNELIAKPPKEDAARPPTDPTITELLILFLEYAGGYYDTTELGNFKTVVEWVRTHAGSTPASEFGPKRLKAIREGMIEYGWTRKSINRQVVRIRQIFTWAVGEEIIPAVNLEALRAVKGLREGRSKAKEKAPIQAVSDADIEATLPHLSPLVADIVRIHRLIGCRPDEVCGMRPTDIDRSGPVWFYSPRSHKNTWRGQNRCIAIGPKAQEILKRYLFGDWCFVSLDKQGTRYSTHSYRRAITRACGRAGVSPWTPGRLRHTTATAVRKQFGLDAAQKVLGHATASTTEIYAELDRATAARVALKIG